MRSREIRTLHFRGQACVLALHFVDEDAGVLRMVSDRSVILRLPMMNSYVGVDDVLVAVIVHLMKTDVRLRVGPARTREMDVRPARASSCRTRASRSLRTCLG